VTASRARALRCPGYGSCLRRHHRGAGSAGSTLAARLTEDGRRSALLLEAGPGGPVGGDDDQLAKVSFALTNRDWGMRASVTPGRDVDYPQGRYVSGGNGPTTRRQVLRWLAAGGGLGLPG
jgi:choline dehydrogenase-like flavoprotein